MKFKACLMKRPRHDEKKKFDDEDDEMEEMEEMDEKEGENDYDDIYDDDDDDYESEGKRPWKKFAGKFKKMGKMYANKFQRRQPSWSLTGTWGKLRNFGRKLVTKVKTTIGYKIAAYGRHKGPQHRRRPHRGPFTRVSIVFT